MSEISELREQRIREGYEELAKLKYDDPNRGKVMGEIKSLEEIQLNLETAETNRLNNNARNLIDEEKLEVEKKKVEVEKKKVGSIWGQVAAYFVMGFGSFGLSYVFEPWFQKNPSMQRFSERCRDLVIKK